MAKFSRGDTDPQTPQLNLEQTALQRALLGSVPICNNIFITIDQFKFLLLLK